MTASTVPANSSSSPAPVTTRSAPSTTTESSTTTKPRCIPKMCGKNEVFLCCGLCSYNTCRGWVGCLDDRCVQGCFCMIGYVRAHPNGPCIRHQSCPKQQFPSVIRE
ncbi:chymotrypsin-elastase inhibitor ixodidin-like [Anopheles stephensi]|uniref:chymotrypsin-elastase inhibitor ixodidin-like n=1 Tax=Anopheles stephensi TaxID=30069 RepID=UPI001658848E|nr:chymotrypsin-elastase inhibitor ixodidin-like [Anopheles stephensi]